MIAKPQVALATVNETREDFRLQRERYVREEMVAVGWLKDVAEVTESEVICTARQAESFAETARRSGAQSLLVHIPVWTDPLLTVQLAQQAELPMLLLGNSRRETSSLVGLLGAGGALDQVGVSHVRIFDHHAEAERRRIIAFARAASAARALKGQVLGLFGGRSLGMVTATADPAQWQRLFGVDIDPREQCLIVQRAQALPAAEVKRHVDWLAARLGGIQHGGRFSPEGLERQVRSYLATRELVREKGYQFVSVKCQPELSDGYASQCVVHMLMNSLSDADGDKPACVHACEADADGALTMQILHLLSGGQPTALLDVRWLDRSTGTWTLANCGALPAAFAATEADPSGLSAVRMVPHVFGSGGGGALPMVASAGEVTLARLCRSAGAYWMAILGGSLETRSAAELSRTTAAFPQAFLRTGAAGEFLEAFGSNHLHMVRGRYEAELEAFCRLKGLKWRRWT